jgi:outer membrane protein, heavy metal efflux system
MNIHIQSCFIIMLSTFICALAHAEMQATNTHVDDLIVNPALNMQVVLEKTFTRNPNQSVLRSRTAIVESKNILANAMLPHAPAVVVGHQNDSFASNRGEREWQADLELPIWLPNQRNNRYKVADATLANANATRESLKLSVAGMLREAMWEVAYNDNNVALTDNQLVLAKRLQQDIQKRFEAGELAKSDLYLAQQEVLKAEKEKLRAHAELMHARYRYQLLTGLHEIPATFDEPKSTIQDYSQSPIWLEAVSKVSLAETELNLAEVESRENPQILLNMRRIQGGFDFTHNDSMGIKIRIPFGSDVRTAPIKAMAASEVGNAMSNKESLRMKLEQAMHEAEHNIEVSNAELEIAKQQHVIAKQSLTLTQKAFELGEMDLVNLLRAQAQFFESERAYSSRQIQLKWDIARYNQAVGVLP